jgi:hypothetical protein
MPVSAFREARAPRHFRVGKLQLPGSLPKTLCKQVHGNNLFPMSPTPSMYIASPTKCSYCSALVGTLRDGKEVKLQSESVFPKTRDIVAPKITPAQIRFAELEDREIAIMDRRGLVMGRSVTHDVLRCLFALIALWGLIGVPAVAQNSLGVNGLQYSPGRWPDGGADSRKERGRNSAAKAAAGTMSVEEACELVGDDARGEQVLKAAAENGDADAEQCLGAYFSLKKMYGPAAVLLRRAADQGHGQAMLGLALAYEKGEGVPKSCDAAQALYTRVILTSKDADLKAWAEIGSGHLFNNGRCAPRDEVSSYKWFDITADHRPLSYFTQSDCDPVSGKLRWACLAARIRQDISTLMTREQINEGRRLAHEWTEAQPQVARKPAVIPVPRPRTETQR